MCCGINSPPPRAEEGLTRHGFTVGERAQVVEDNFFKGWHGHVRTFESQIVAVDLDEPPAGHQLNGQWFRPSDLRSAPE